MDPKIREILKKNDIFKDLDETDMEKIFAVCRMKEIKEQEEIFQEGDTGRDLYILLKGRVNIEIQLKLKSEKATVHTVSEGEIFGEFALVDGEARSASATAVKDAGLIIIPREGLEGLIENNPRIGYIIMKNFSKILCGRIRKTTRELRASLMWD